MKPWPQASALDVLLSDSLVQLAMRADRVEPQALKSLLSDVGRKLAARREVRLLAGPARFHRAAVTDSMKAGPLIDGGALCGLAACW
jgi:hypothetical protein